MRRRRSGQSIALVVLILTSQVIRSPVASAVSCGAGKHIFIRNGASSPNPRWGVKGKIKVPQNQLDATCNSAVFTTIHLEDCSSICGTQVEIGLKHYSPADMVIWTEQSHNGVVTNNDDLRFANFDEFISFRLKVSQAGDVIFEFNTGGGWLITSSSPYTVNWGSGYPMGETEKKGDGTQMSSHHRNLQYLTSTWSEVDWPSMTCVQDEAPGWSWSPLSGSTNDYDVVNVGGGTCDPV